MKPDGVFRKSSFSADNGNCVEVALNLDDDWVKSSFSSFDGNCLQIRRRFLTVAVRDSKAGDDGDVLHFSPAAWREFVDSVKAGEMEQG